MEKKFEDYGFRPSAVIAGLNKWYETGDEHALIRFADHFFYDHDKVVDDAIKYLRSFDIFYAPGMKWDDIKFKLNSRACLAEFGFNNVHDAWPKVNPCFVDPRTERENEIRDYILKQADAAGIKIYIRDESPEDLIRYLISLLVRNRNNAEVERERADGYLEKIDRLQKELDGWECWYNDKEHYVK